MTDASPMPMSQSGTASLHNTTQANAQALEQRAQWAQQKLNTLMDEQSTIPGKGLLFGTLAGAAAFFAPAFTFLKDKAPKWRWGGSAAMGIAAFAATSLITMEIMARRVYAKAVKVKEEFDQSQAELGPFPEQMQEQQVQQTGASPAAMVPPETTLETAAPMPSRITEILKAGKQNLHERAAPPAPSKTDAVLEQQLAQEAAPALS